MTNMSIAAIKPSLENSALARLLGARRSHVISGSVALKVKELGTRLEQLMVPHLHYETKRIESINREVINLGGSEALRGQNLSKAMKDCEKIICFVATIGSGIEKEIVRLMGQNRLSDAYILDSLGSVAVEDMVEKFHQWMMTKYESEGKGVTYRFSPGYCDWPITEQKVLFKLFDSTATGVELLDSCLMMPRKSVSGVFGVYSDIGTKPFNPCLECPKKICEARRA